MDRLENLVLDLMRQTNASSSVALNKSLLPDDLTPPSANVQRLPVTDIEARPDVSPCPSDYGSIKIRESGSRYVSNAHWAAVLDSIAELKDHFERDEEPTHPQIQFPGPQLLYVCPLHVTPASIIESMPSRAIVDKLVSRYFNDLDVATGKHRTFSTTRQTPDFSLN